ncbi:MAG: GNAT family N-acetyltransferase [Promethearchaeota archaeon]|jgi:ribosomal protein S18 acetylase RimI-like enzyme
MVEFVTVNIYLHKSYLLKLTVEYFTWINDEVQKRYNIDTFSILGNSILEYTEKTLEDFSSYIPPKGIYYVIQMSSFIIGMGALRTIKDGVGEIKRMYIKPEYRGYGYGKKILDQLLKKRKEFGFSSIRLDTGNFMTAAQRVYRLAGFQERERYLESEVPEVFLPHWQFMEKFF